MTTFPTGYFLVDIKNYPYTGVCSPIFRLNFHILDFLPRELLYKLGQISGTKMVPMYAAILILLPAMALSATSQPPADMALELFHDVDRNRDGQVTRAEVDLYFIDYDVNNNGQVSPQEFSQYVYRHYPHLSAYDTQLYGFFDFNNDRILNHHDFDNLFAQMDSNANGLVSQGEFVRYFSVIFESLGG